MALVNALLKTKERHTHRQWILNWLEDNYESKKGATICKASVFSDYAEVCRLQTLKPVTNSLFGKLVKAVFPTIRTCRKGPRSDSRTHYNGLHRRRDTISLPRVCPETGELLPSDGSATGITSFIPAPSSASSSMSSSAIMEAIPLHSADCSLTSSPAPSSPASSCVSYDMSPVASSSVVEASGALPAFQFTGQPSHAHHATIGDHRLHRSAQFPAFVVGHGHGHSQQHHHYSDQHAAVHQLYFTPSLSSGSSGSAYDDTLTEFEEMDIGGAGASNDNGGHAHNAGDLHDSCFTQLPLPAAPQCLCPSCGVGADSTSGTLTLDEHESSSLESVEDILGDLEPRLLNLDPSMLHHLTSSSASGDHSAFCFSESTADCCGSYAVPAVQMSSSMMAPPVSPSPPASPPPPLSLMSAPELGSCAHNNKLRPFLRRTMAKASAQAAEGNPLAEGFMGMINTCQKIIKDRAQKRRRKSISDALAAASAHIKQEHYQHAAKKQHMMAIMATSATSPTVDTNALVPPFVLSLEEIPGSQNNFAFQESVLVFANEYRKMFQAVFDRLVRFEYAILFDVVFSFWNQVKLQPNFSFLLDHDSVKRQILAYDAKVLHTFKDYFLMNPLKMSAQQFGGFLQTIAFHLPFSVERATLQLLPADLGEEKMRLLQTFAADLQGQAQSLTLPHAVHHSQQQQHSQQQTIMEINNY